MPHTPFIDHSALPKELHDQSMSMMTSNLAGSKRPHPEGYDNLPQDSESKAISRGWKDPDLKVMEATNDGDPTNVELLIHLKVQQSSACPIPCFVVRA